MKKDELFNTFVNVRMKALPKKSDKIIAMKNKKGLFPLDSGAMVAIKGGDNNKPRINETN